MKTLSVVLTVLLCGAALSHADIPIPSLSSWSHGLTAPAGLCVCPAGDGDPLSAMQNGIATVDGTITVNVINILGEPVTNYPQEDLWLEAFGMPSCGNGGLDADAPTDAMGVTTFSGAPAMGGVMSDVLMVMIAGTPCENPGFNENLIHFTSPDLDGNGQVDLSDVVEFVDRLETNPSDPAIDFFFDGQQTLSDIVVFAQHLNHTCR